ncbi:uncharacterized protein BDR25DRAFT_350774 [Lindgomyces ingoldianus]|uniref:Uncharacterized protein n=1 Tax=Lindgomyces ingoldianus TaxID=673940 RepID=A0ACB6R7V6_9PLEO|nr:uncharacterized protein BDR25DRAFT_350774 [Lindgomyces ingoldianus]KAF2475399.1 hypothetical protein BDR25DRAFT_350774 [Lindgomyces ingoldianus]
MFVIWEFMRTSWCYIHMNNSKVLPIQVLQIRSSGDYDDEVECSHGTTKLQIVKERVTLPTTNTVFVLCIYFCLVIPYPLSLTLQYGGEPTNPVLCRLSSEQQCSICTEEYDSGPHKATRISLPECNHVFCLLCLNDMFSHRRDLLCMNLCPLCRTVWFLSECPEEIERLERELQRYLRLGGIHVTYTKTLQERRTLSGKPFQPPRDVVGLDQAGRNPFEPFGRLLELPSQLPFETDSYTEGDPIPDIHQENLLGVLRRRSHRTQRRGRQLVPTVPAPNSVANNGASASSDNMRQLGIPNEQPPSQSSSPRLPVTPHPDGGSGHDDDRSSEQCSSEVPIQRPGAFNSLNSRPRRASPSYGPTDNGLSGLSPPNRRIPGEPTSPAPHLTGRRRPPQLLPFHTNPPFPSYPSIFIGIEGRTRPVQNPSGSQPPRSSRYRLEPWQLSPFTHPTRVQEFQQMVQQREQAMDQRQQGLQQREQQLQQSEQHLQQREQQLRQREQQLQRDVEEQRLEHTRANTDMNERGARIDARETVIEKRLQALTQSDDEVNQREASQLINGPHRLWPFYSVVIFSQRHPALYQSQYIYTLGQKPVNLNCAPH